MLKKILFALLGIIVVNYSWGKNLNYYDCIQTDTTPYGCANKNENTEPNLFGGINYLLRCNGAGLVICQFSDGECPPIVIQTIDDIEEQIYVDGILFGTVTESWGSYTWNAQSTSTFEYTIEYEFDEE